MKTKEDIFKAEIEGKVELRKLEEVVTSQGGTMLRADQGEKKTAAFFAGSKEAAEKARKGLAKYGKVKVRAAREADLLKLP